MYRSASTPFVFLASWDAIEPGLLTKWVTDTNEPTELTWLVWPWWVNIPTEDFTDETLGIDNTLVLETQVVPPGDQDFQLMQE